MDPGSILAIRAGEDGVYFEPLLDRCRGRGFLGDGAVLDAGDAAAVEDSTASGAGGVARDGAALHCSVAGRFVEREDTAAKLGRVAAYGAAG